MPKEASQRLREPENSNRRYPKVLVVGQEPGIRQDYLMAYWRRPAKSCTTSRRISAPLRDVAQDSGMTEIEQGLVWRLFA